MGQRGRLGPDDKLILNALCERPEEGMTVFELRYQVPTDIDRLERSLERFKREGLIETERIDDRIVIRPTDAGVSTVERGDSPSVLGRIRERLPL